MQVRDYEDITKTITKITKLFKITQLINLY